MSINFYRLVFYFFVILTFFYFVNAFIGAFIPVFIALFLAYLNRPLLDWLEKNIKISHSYLAALVAFLNILFLCLFISIFIPVLYSQTNLFISNLPRYKVMLNSHFNQATSMVNSDFLHNLKMELNDYIWKILDVFFNSSSNLLANLWSYALNTFKALIDLIIIPIILFYLLRDWPKTYKYLKGLIPEPDRENIEKIMTDINRFLRLYIVGQLSLCFYMMCLYAIALRSLSIDFSFLLGFISGLAILVPFVGSFFSIGLGLFVTYMNFGVSNTLAAVVILYFVGNILENYILTPKIIGSTIGLHPAIILISVLVSLELNSFIYVMFAIPIVGICKILFSYLIVYYRTTKLYKG